MASRSPASSALLPDGRVLAYSEYGDRGGVPFVFMHGIPSSRLAAAMIDAAAVRAGVRLIAPDRPGYGHSDPSPGRTLLDWPRDVEALANALHVREFGVLGISGAVPYLLACAVAIPERLTHVAILSGLGPLTEPGVMAGMNRQTAVLYRLALRSPRLGRMWMTMLAQTARRSPLLVYRQQLAYLPPVDRAVFDAPEMRELRLDDFAEAFRQGADSAAREAVLHVTEWGFRLQDVALEVFVWQGEADRHHPVAMGRFLERGLPSARAMFVPEAGAFGFVERMDEVFERLLSVPAHGHAAVEAARPA
ncbi:MAG: alpha/beta hydrolase [Dehalococcoidia bacterium]